MTSINETFSFADNCLDSYNLKEFYCMNDWVYNELIYCSPDYGTCIGGACVNNQTS